MNNNNVRCKFNPGSDLLIISENTWKKLLNRNWRRPKKLQEVYLLKNYNSKV